MKNLFSPRTTTPRRILTHSIATAAIFFLGQEAHGGNSTWNGTTDGTWSAAANWSAGGPALGDSAIFSNAGNGNTAIDLGAGVTLDALLFDTAAAAAYTIGSGASGSQVLTLNNGGGITVSSSVTKSQTINSNIVLGTDGSTQSFTFNSNSTAPDQFLKILGGISGSSGAGVKTLTISGAGNTIISGLIDNGPGGGRLALTKTGSGTLSLNGAVSNTYTGATTVDAGTLVLDFANAATPTDLISNQSALVLNGGTLQVLQKSGVATSQSFASTTLGAGNSTIAAVNHADAPSNLTLALGEIAANRAAGATANFLTPTTGAITTTSSNTYNILGTWATIGTGTSMTYAKVVDGKIVAAEQKLGGDINISVTQDKWDGTGTQNYRLTGFIGLTGDRSLNALQLGGESQTVRLGNSQLMLNGLMSVGTGNQLVIERGSGGTGNVVIGSNRELVITGSSSLHITAPIVDNSAGASSLTYSGTGTLTLSSPNTFSGTTTINAGVLKIGSGGSTGSIGEGNIVNNSALELGRSDTFTLPNAISGTGTLTKLTSGTAILSGNSSYSGVTTVSAGILSIAHNNALGSAAGGTTVAGVATLLLQDGVTVTGETVTLAAGGNGVSNLGTLAADSNSTATWAGTVDMSGGVVRVGAREGGVLILSGPIVNGTDLLISSNDLMPTGTVVIAGTNNTYRGVTNVIRGTLKLGADNALPVTTILDVHNAGTPNPAAFDLGGFNQTVAGLRRTDASGPSTVTNSSDTLSVLTVNGSSNTTFGGNIIGGANLALTKAGTSRLTLTGTNTYSGRTTISGGILRIGDGGTTGSLGSGDIVNNATLETNRAGTLTLSNNISGTGQVVISGEGTTILSGTNTYTGTTQINAGRADIAGSLTSNVTLANGASIGGEGLITGSITFNGENSLYFDPRTSGALTANTVIASGAMVTVRLVAGSPAAEGIVVISAPGGITGTGDNFHFTGRGSTYLSPDNTQLLFDYTPALLKWKGNDLSAPMFWNVDTMNWDNAGKSDNFVSGDSVVFDDTAASFTVIAQATGVEAGNVTFNNSDNAYTLYGGSIAGIGSLTKKGTNTLFISNNNTYTGGTTIEGGMIQLGDGSSPDGTLGSGLVTNNASLVTDFGFNDITFANVIAGSGTLTKNGAGTLTVTGNNTYSGGTTISAGTLQLNTGASLGSGPVTNNSQLLLNRAGTSTFTNPIGGTGDVTTQNNALVTFGSSNTYSGTTTILSGALIVAGDSNVLGNTSAGTIVNSGATLGLSGGIHYDAGEALTISGTGVASTEFFFPGSFNQRGALQSVSGDNTWAGNVTVTGSNTRIGVQDGASLTLTGTITDGGAGHTVIFRGGTGTPGMITISGTGNSWGRTDVYGSSTRIGIDNALPVSAPLYVGTTNVGDSIFDLNGFDQAVAGIAHVGGAVESNIITNNGSSDSVLTLIGSENPDLQNFNFTGILRDGPTHKLSLVKAGSFTQTLSGPTTYTGSTDITEGTLTVAATGSIEGSTSINISGGATFHVHSVPGGFTLGSTQSITGGEGKEAGVITGTLVAGSGSTVAPGLGGGSTGALSISNGFTLNSEAHLSLDIGGLKAGEEYDQLIVSGGNISLSGDLQGSVLTFEPTDFADVFFIIVNNGTGTTSGTLNGVGEGGSIVISGQEFQISYTSDFETGFTLNGTGNDVALLAVPEPGAVVSVLSGIGMLLGFRRRR